MNNKIAVIVPYFGKFPKWMNLFVEGCKNNGFIDFLIFSNDEIKQHADNIICHKTTFEDYCKLVAKELNIKFAPQSPYKLCGVRPFYGYIHREELSSYDFWGFCDLDLAFGDLSKCFSFEKLQQYDVISTDWDRMSGPLCILRNNEYLRKIAFKIPNWKQMLESDQMIPLDEKYLSDIIAIELKALRGIDSRILRTIIPLKYVRIIDKILAYPVHLLLRKKRLSFGFYDCTPEIGYSKMEFVYQNHTVIERDTGKELPYLHFLFFKKNLYRKDYLWTDASLLSTDYVRFDIPVYIDKHGIYNKV